MQTSTTTRAPRNLSPITYHLLRITSVLVLALALAGCASYRLGSNVPQDLRTIAVPVFENASGHPEIDALTTQHTLRELQREGTFKITDYPDASLRLLGKITRAGLQSLNYDRNYGARASEYRLAVTAEITLIERHSGKILIDAMPVKANTTFLTRGDMQTGMSDAYPRLARDLARNITDTILAHWEQ